MGKIDTSKFKDGDILYASSKSETVYTVFIYKKDTPYLTGCYASFYLCTYGYGEMDFEHEYAMEDDSIDCVRYANKLEKKQFFKNLDLHGYIWDEKNKKLENFFKDGEFLYVEIIGLIKEKTYIYRYKKNNNNLKNKFNYNPKNYTSSYYSYNVTDDILNEEMLIADDFQIKNIRLATQEEKMLLFDAIHKNGYISYDKKIEKIKKEIINLKPFDKVLVRKHEYCIWECDFYSHIEYINGDKFHKVINNGLVKECIEFNDETIYLLGTADAPSEKYKN